MSPRKNPPRRPLPKAATSVDNTATFYHYLGQKIEKYGIRVAVVQMLPKPVFDITIKDKK